MKRLFFMLAVVAATTVSSLSAQNHKAPQQKGGEERPNREEMVDKRQADLAEKIGLSESQATELKNLNSTFITESKIIVEAMQRSVQDIDQKKMKSIVELLNDDQMVNYLMMIDRRNPRGGRGAMQGAPRGGMQMAQAQRGEQPTEGARPNGQMRGERPEGQPQGQPQAGQRGERPEGQAQAGQRGERPEQRPEGGQAQAGQRGERPERGEMDSKREADMAEKLGISEDQAKQLSEINASYMNERKALVEGAQKAKQELEQNKMKSLVELLDDDQMAKYLAMGSRQNPQGRRGQQGGRGQMQGGGNRPMPMAQGGEKAPEQGEGEEGGRPREGKGRPGQPRGAAE